MSVSSVSSVTVLAAKCVVEQSSRDRVEMSLHLELCKEASDYGEQTMDTAYL